MRTDIQNLDIKNTAGGKLLAAMLSLLLTLSFLNLLLFVDHATADEAVGKEIYVSSQGSDEVGNGTKDNPYASLNKAVGVASNNDTVCVMTDLVSDACVSVWKKSITIKSVDGQHTVARGDISPRRDNARSMYNPAMIEVNGQLRLENIILDDGKKTAGMRFAQATTDGKGGNEDTVQDAIIATYDSDGDIVVLGDGAELRNFGGMSAVRLSAGSMTMESGSKIVGSKEFDTRGEGFGPAGAVWIQGGKLVMEEGAHIGDMFGRAVYVDSGSAELSGTISGITPNACMWQGAEGVGVHVRNGGSVVLKGAIEGADGNETAVVTTGSGTKFEMREGSSISNLKKAVSAGDNCEVIINGEITGIRGGNAVNMSGGVKCVVGRDAEIHHNNVWRGAIYCQSGELHIFGYFHHNFNASDRSGAIEINNNGSGSKATIYDGARITNNYARETGGGVMVTNGVLVMKGGEITNNIAGTFGGGLSIRKGGQFIMEGGLVARNASAGLGAGISYEATDWNSNCAFVELLGGEIADNKTNVTISPDPENLTASFVGGVENDLAISTADGPSTVNRFFKIGPLVKTNREVAFAVDNKAVIVDDGTNFGNASSSDISALSTQGKSWGFSKPLATLWVQNEAGTQATISGLTVDAQKPVWVLAKVADEITRFPATITNGAVVFNAPASATGCALAVVQPAEGSVTVTLSSAVTRIVQNALPHEIPYRVTYALAENVDSNVLDGATDMKVTFLLKSGEKLVELNIGDKTAIWNESFDEADFKAGESLLADAVLTFKNNNISYTFYSNSLEIPMVAAPVVTPPTPTPTPTYPLTITYVFEDGSEAAPAHSENLQVGAEYRIESPEVEGHTADRTEVAGTMPATAVNVTVTYAANPVAPDPGPTPPPTPTPTPTPTAPTPEAPATAAPAPAPAPEATPTAEEAAPDEVTEIIEDAATPQAASVSAEEPAPEPIAEEATPLGAFDEPKCSTHWLMLIGIIVTAIYGIAVVRRRLAMADGIDGLENQVLGQAESADAAISPAASQQAL